MKDKRRGFDVKYDKIRADLWGEGVDFINVSIMKNRSGLRLMAHEKKSFFRRHKSGLRVVNTIETLNSRRNFEMDQARDLRARSRPKKLIFPFGWTFATRITRCKARGGRFLPRPRFYPRLIVALDVDFAPLNGDAGLAAGYVPWKRNLWENFGFLGTTNECHQPLPSPSPISLDLCRRIGALRGVDKSRTRRGPNNTVKFTLKRF